MESILIKDLLAVVTQDEQRRILKNVDIRIEGSEIVAVGKDLPSPADVVIDGRGKVAIPGLINSHTHIPMTLFRGVADDMDLMTWLKEKIWPMEAHLTAEEVAAGAALGMLESLRTGTTTFADMYFFEDSIAEEAIKLSIRAVLAESYIGFGSPVVRDGWKAFEYAKAFVKRWKNKSDLIVPSLGPHAPYSVEPDLLRASAEAARELEVPLQIHLAEDYSEIVQVREKYGNTPIKHVDSLGIFDGVRVIAAHVVYPQEGELEILSKKRVLAAHCPISNLKTGAGFAPVPKLLEAGVYVGLGTDGAGSNNCLDMFETMKYAALIHKGYNRDPKLVSAQQVLDMATVMPARALGLNVGSIEEGRLADIVLVSTESPWWQPIHSVVSHLVYSARSTDVTHVIVNGRLVIENGRLITADEEEIKRRAREAALKLLQKGGVQSFLSEVS